MVLIDCNGTSVTGWGIGDVVHNKDAGSTWQGVVVETNSGGKLGAADLALVWLDSGYDEDTILVAEGVTNDDAGGGANDPTDVDPLAARSTPGIKVDTNSGSTTAAITLAGVNSSWTEDGTRTALDAKGKASYNFNFSGTRNYFVIRNISGKNAVSHGWYASAQLGYSHFENCEADNSGGDGFGGGVNIMHSSFHRCVSHDCSGTYGFRAVYSTLAHCTAYNIANTGFYPHTCTCWDCVAFQCVYGFRMLNGTGLYNCVADDNTNGIYTIITQGQIVGCRITNNSGYGISGTYPISDKYCFYSDNGANFESDIHDDTVDGASTRVTSGTVGYIDGGNATLADRNYGLTNQAAARRQEATL